MTNDSRQKAAFIEGEGDRWFERNAGARHIDLDERARTDAVVEAIRALDIHPEAVLEIGCASGWRLGILDRLFGCRCFGLDPSFKAVSRGMELYPGVALTHAAADALPFQDASFDLFVAGFCLYLCDRGDLFKIAWECDRVLRSGGFAVIFDFDPPFAYRNPYVHRPGMDAYKMNYSGMFLWNPNYNLAYHRSFCHGSRAFAGNPDERIAVSVLRKGDEAAYPASPFQGGQTP